MYGSTTSSDSQDSRSWVRGDHPSNHQYFASDGAGPFFSSPSDISQVPQWTPPAIQGINFNDYETARRDPVPGPLSFTPTLEGTSANPDDGGSSSSRSDGSDYEPTTKSQLFSHCNFSSRSSFMSKAIHPLSLPTHIPIREASCTRSTGFPEFDASIPQSDTRRWSSASSSIDFADVSESFDSEIFAKSVTLSEAFKCGLCGKFLSQRSPWSSRRIVRSGDMPVAGVLSCRHVFHAECLEQTTSKTSKNDPPCPLCLKAEETKSPDQRVCNRFRNGFPRLRPSSEDGPSKSWACAQAGDCVEGALHAPPRNTMLLLNKNQIKKNLSLKGNSSKEYPGKLRKVGSYSSQILNGRTVEQEAVGCSKSTASPSMKRC